MMHVYEVLLKIHKMPHFFFKKKVGKTRVFSYSPVFSLANVFLDSLSSEVEPKKSRAEVAFFLFRFDGTEVS